MTDREKVIKALEKEITTQEPILAEDFYKPILNEGLSYVPYAWRCGACGSPIKYHQKYCRMCRRAVEWDDA